MFIYQHAIKGFAASLPEQAVEALSRNPNVELRRAGFRRSGPSGPRRAPPGGSTGSTSDALPLDSSYTYDDTRRRRHGLHHRHRASASATASSAAGRSTAMTPSTATAAADDCNGHGTHVAGTVGGTDLRRGQGREARRRAGARLPAARARRAGVIAGIDWVTSNARQAGRREHEPRRRRHTALDTAVKNSIASGVTYAVAAGNGNSWASPDACNYSPAAGPRGDHRRRHRQHRRARPPGPTTALRRPVRPGRGHHLGLERQRHRHEHHQRHVDGHPAHGRRRRPVPAGQPRRQLRPQVRDALYDADDQGRRHSTRRRPTTICSTAWSGALRTNTPPTAGFTYSDQRR